MMIVTLQSVSGARLKIATFGKITHSVTCIVALLSEKSRICQKLILKRVKALGTKVLFAHSHQPATADCESNFASFCTGDVHLAETMTHADRERNRLANTKMLDYLDEWLEGHQHDIERETYHQYKRYIDGRIREFFTPLDLTVKDLSGDEINEFYTYLRNAGLKGSTGQRYHGVLHKAFKDAVKRRIIPSNPVDQANRPRKEQFIAAYYNAEEVKQLLELVKDDEIYIPILLAAYYGLRRSEVVGLKWSAIDFSENTLTVRHTVHSTEEGIVAKDRLKTKSSYRTLTLEPFVRGELLRHREKQEQMKKVMRSAYSKDYTDYVCVDALGKLYDPDFVTGHFGQLLKKHNLKKIRFHDLRHSCASVLLAQGVPMKQIREWLGHSDISTTANIYSRLDAVPKRTPSPQ